MNAYRYTVNIVYTIPYGIRNPVLDVHSALCQVIRIRVSQKLRTVCPNPVAYPSPVIFLAI